MTGEVNGKKRQNKGQFKKGSPGGPGRGHKSNEPDDPHVELVNLSKVISSLQKDLNSKVPKERNDAARLILSALKQTGKSEVDDNVMDLWVIELIGFLSQMQENIHQGTGQTVTGMDVIRKMSKSCLTCEKIGAVDANLPEVEE